MTFHNKLKFNILQSKKNIAQYIFHYFIKPKLNLLNRLPSNHRTSRQLLRFAPKRHSTKYF